MLWTSLLALGLPATEQDGWLLPAHQWWDGQCSDSVPGGVHV